MYLCIAGFLSPAVTLTQEFCIRHFIFYVLQLALLAFTNMVNYYLKCNFIILTDFQLKYVTYYTYHFFLYHYTT